MDAQRFDRWTRELSAGASRRRILRGLVGGAAGLAGAALGRTVARAAPNSCNAAGSLFFPPGPGRAAFIQACKKCNSDVDRVCESQPGSFTCCPQGLSCNFNCETGRSECCVEDTCGNGSCGTTCGQIC